VISRELFVKGYSLDHLHLS